MTIFNKSKMEIGASVLIRPIKISEQGVEGKYGMQDQWYVKITGNIPNEQGEMVAVVDADATTYTGYKDGQQDWHGDTLTAAMENDLELVLTKTFNTKTQRPKYGYHPNKGQSPTQEVKVAQNAPQTPKTAFVVRKDVKGIKMGMIGCAKAVHNPTDSVDQQFYKAQKLFKAIEMFVLVYDGRPDLEIIQKKMIDAGTSDDFWGWLAKQYKVDDKYSLQVKDTIYTIDHFVQAGAKFITDTAAAIKAKDQATSAIPQQDEDVIREQSFEEHQNHFVEGPMETTFPADEVCPEPVVIEDQLPF